MRVLWYSLLLLLFPFEFLKAQLFKSPKQTAKASFYFAFGTHRSFYSRTDIHLKSVASPIFDFTLQNVRGKDDGGLKFNSEAPQYNYELGYYNEKQNWGVEFNFDHIKYFVRQWQRVTIKGTIDGKFYDGDSLLSPDFIQLEHSDGGNYALIKLVNKKPINKNDNGRWLLLFKAGAGPVIPKTNSTIMGKHRDDRYKISGYVLALESGLRYNFSKLFFSEASVKGAYANYSRFLIADGTGSQKWCAVHLGLMVGVQFSR